MSLTLDSLHYIWTRFDKIILRVKWQTPDFHR
jgi:hypothetical protein